MENAHAALPIQTPLTDSVVAKLRVGQRVHLSGVIYTARDAAHQRLMTALENGQDLSIPLAGQVLSHAHHHDPPPPPYGNGNGVDAGASERRGQPLLQ